MKIGIIGIGLMGGSFALDFRSIYKNSKIYGFDVDIKNFKYSIENKIVTTHSAIFKYSLYTLFMDSMLSSETKKTLNNIVISSKTSKSLPADVSASYMIV